MGGLTKVSDAVIVPYFEKVSLPSQLQINSYSDS